jgi:hypothetical protein
LRWRESHAPGKPRRASWSLRSTMFIPPISRRLYARLNVLAGHYGSIKARSAKVFGLGRDREYAAKHGDIVVVVRPIRARSSHCRKLSRRGLTLSHQWSSLAAQADEMVRRDRGLRPPVLLDRDGVIAIPKFRDRRPPGRKMDAMYLMEYSSETVHAFYLDATAAAYRSRHALRCRGNTESDDNYR